MSQETTELSFVDDFYSHIFMVWLKITKTYCWWWKSLKVFELFSEIQSS